MIRPIRSTSLFLDPTKLSVGATLLSYLYANSIFIYTNGVLSTI